MRLRRGLSQRTEQAVAKLSDQDVEDLLNALPFLAPVLPVPGHLHGAPGTGRTPRRGSLRGKITPRPSLNSARGSDAGHAGPPASPTQRQTTTEHRLNAPEVELATKAWLQILASNASSDGDAANGGGPTSPLKANAAPTAAALFSKACTTVSSLSSGKQLKDILQLLHVPVLSILGELLDDVVELLSSTGSPNEGKASLHFFRFLQFLGHCKHLDAIRKHRQLQQRGLYLPPASPTLAVDAEDPYGGEEGAPTSAEGIPSDHVLVDEKTELNTEDFEAAFEYVTSTVQGGHDSDGGDEGSDTASYGSGRGGVVVSAKALEQFAHSFLLSLRCVLPSEYLLEPPPTPARTISPAATARRDHHNSSFLHHQVSTDYSGVFSSSFLGGGSPLPPGSPTATSRAASGPLIKAPPSLMPNMATHMISVTQFASHVESLPDDRPSSPLLISMSPIPADGVSITRETEVHSKDQPASTIRPLRLGGVVVTPATAKHDRFHNQMAGGGGGKDGAGTTGEGSPDQAHSMASPKGSASGGTAAIPTLVALQPYATWMEKRSPLSTVQLPPLIYTSYVESKERKRREDREKKENEARLREEYLYGPPRPKPKVRTAEEESIAALHAVTDMVERRSERESNNLFDVREISIRLRNMQVHRLETERREANRYAFMMGGAANRKDESVKQKPIVLAEPVRQAAALELLNMLKRCPDDSILGAQQGPKRAHYRKGMGKTVE